MSVQQAIVFIPGYKGSILKASSNKTVSWLTASQIFPWDKTELALTIPGTGVQDSHQIYPDGILEELKLLPCLSKSIYHSFLLRLKRIMPDWSVLPFSYDWRLDLFSQVRRFHEFVFELKEQGCRNIHIIAHSMGGIIVAYWLKYGNKIFTGNPPDWEGFRMIDKVVFAGVPFQGTSKAVLYALQGNPVALNKRILSSAVVSTFPAAYQMFPKMKSSVLYSLETREPIDIFNAEVWPKYEMGFVGNTPAGIEFIARQVKAGLNMKAAIHLPSAITQQGGQPLKILNLSSRGYKTMHQFLWSKNRHALVSAPAQGKEFPGAYSPYIDGDGIVTVDSSTLPAAYQSSGINLAVTIQHEEFFNLSGIEKTISEFLLNG